MLLHRLILIILLVAMSAAAATAQELATFRSGIYEVATDIPLDEARPIASRMNAIQSEYKRRFSKFPARNATRVTLYIMSSSKSYREMLDTKGIDGTNSGGMFFVKDGEGGLATFVHDQSEQRMLHTLQHEGFHQFAHINIADDLPIWINEGCAEYFGEALEIRNRFETGLAPKQRVDRVKKLVREKKAIPFRDMVVLSSAQWSATLRSDLERGRVQYDQSWAMVHYLIHGEGGRFGRMFDEYVRQISRGVDPILAFEKAFRTADIESFQRSWMIWVETWEPDQISTAMQTLELLATALEGLHSVGIVPDSIESLQEALRNTEATITRTDGGVREEFALKDLAGLEMPEPNRRSQKIELSLLPPVQHQDTPPRLAISGLRVPLGLQWEVDRSGGFTSEIVFKRVR